MKTLGIATQVVFYGLLAGASAVAATSVLVVLRTRHGRVNGAAYAIGFLAAQFFVCVIALSFGLQWTPSRGTAHSLFAAILETLIGVALLGAAWRVRHPAVRPPRQPRRLEAQMTARRDAALERLGSLRAGPILGTGALLGVGGPKRLTLTLLAAATIAAGRLPVTSEASLVAVYVAIATILVWVPVMLTLAFGAKAAEWTAQARAWCVGHRAILTFVPLLVFGVYFAFFGIVGLVKA